MTKGLVPRFFALLAIASITLAACGGGGGGSSSVPSTTHTATPTATPTSTATSNPAAFTCPTSDTTTAVARSGGSFGTEVVRRASGLRVQRPTAASATQLAVTYSAASVSGREAALMSKEQAAGGTLLKSLSFAYIGQLVHVLSVPASQMASAESTLRSQAGVISVEPTGGRRFSTSVSTPYWTSDPYFNGFQNPIAPSASATVPPSTYRTFPYVESNSVPGQWDMHAIELEYAFGYSLGGNSVPANSGALGSPSIKIAIIDTGEDTTHPELHTKIVGQGCFITNYASGTPGPQSTSSYETDPLGHGTDVAGIAAEDMNNGFGFTGAGGNTEILGYRVFPTPDDNCTNDNTTDNQCSSDTSDIASAIDAAVTAGANIISMSLGGGGCNGGVDTDPVERAAVANAISHNVIVIAASGNGAPQTTAVGAPACDTGVIAVGATALADGSANPNGSGYVLGSSMSPVEYVTSYTQYGSTNTYQNPASWGIVAPGGDPSGTGNTSNDNDDLHWIENIWTTTPYMANSSDTSFEGSCVNDYPFGTLTTSPDCRTLIAGTSMATPHVAGVAALVLAVTGGTMSTYQIPANMKTLLCQTADQLTGPALALNPNEGCGRLNAYRAVAQAVGDTANVPSGLPTDAP